MISVQEASSIILSNLFLPASETIHLNNAGGHVLAASVFADRDLPPFDRVAMDGIAFHSSFFLDGQRDFMVEGTQAAGLPQQKLKNVNACLEVMTGAVLPDGTDTVVRYEDLQIKKNVATVLIDNVAARQNIHPQGQDARQGEELLASGMKISSAEVALLASVGMSQVKVLTFPKTAIVSTGDELVDVNQTPLPHQIRRSNDRALQAALQEMGCSATAFHLADSKAVLETELARIFQQHTLIILSGGVSKGKFDFIPDTLESLGVKKLFHQVSQKPGKPFWFGKSEKQTVFALPGNPVSTYMCFYRYIKPWLLKSLKLDTSAAQAILAEDVFFKPELTYFLQVKIQNEKGRLLAHPHAGGGSGDFANLKNIDGFLELPAGRQHFAAGEAFSYFPFRQS